MFVPGLPVAADGASFDEAIAEMVDALREYAEDWRERLLDAPSHRGNRDLVRLIGSSDDAQLRAWLVGSAP
ncbi:type II toxin-antitoxin system HicB family antitoxin [Saccharothrix sp. Mg75]|uniref:type II toxin-antitoxin system HicB family antitoxin n=1 Tax=Saccharothrix sp. Mg75 TaxID=3445357 RepID=UPI003EE867C1